MRNNKIVIFAGALALGLIAGCSKKDAATTTTANPTGEPTTANAAPATATPNVPLAPAEQEANTRLKDLQLQVDAYEKIYKRKPASLAQMVQEGFLPSLPPAPPGRRFEYDPAANKVSLAP